LERFERDLEILVEKLRSGLNRREERTLTRLKDRLLLLRKKNLVKINHSVMELVLAKYLIKKGYQIELEHPLDETLVCDLYGVKGLGTLVVEIETGFVPPEHALDPIGYIRVRVASKIIRYSNYANKFGLGTPPQFLLQIPTPFTKPPRYRSEKELRELKEQCDSYYQHPPVTLKEILNANLHSVYIIQVDDGRVVEMDPWTYIEKCSGALTE